LTSQPRIVWRIAAALLWISSVACFFRAITSATNAEEGSVLVSHSDADRLVIQREAMIADRCAVIGWLLQFAAAAVLSFGLKFPRVARRIFVSLGVIIGVDGVALLLLSVIIRV
jgi:hypothetical protein